MYSNYPTKRRALNLTNRHARRGRWRRAAWLWFARRFNLNWKRTTPW